MSEVVFDVIADSIRIIGWAVLKFVTVGRYKSPGDQPARLFEGTVGLLVVAGAFAFSYSFGTG